MITLLVVLIICSTSILVSGIAGVVMYGPIRIQAKTRAAELEMQKDLHQVNLDNQKQMASLRAQYYLDLLNDKKELPAEVLSPQGNRS